MDDASREDHSSRGPALVHYTPENVPTAPYTKVLVNDGKSKGTALRNKAAAGDSEDGAPLDTSFELVTMPDPVGGSESPTSGVKSKRPSDYPQPSMLSKLAGNMRRGKKAKESQSAASPSAGEVSPKTVPAAAPAVVLVAQAVDAAPEAYVGQVEPTDSLYEPMDMGRQLQPFSATLPKSSASEASASRAQAAPASTSTIRNLPQDEDALEESFAYASREALTLPAHAAAPAAHSAPGRIKMLGDVADDSFDYQPVEVLKQAGAVPLVVGEYIDPTEVANDIEERGSDENVDDVSTLTPNNLYMYVAHKPRYSVRTPGSKAVVTPPPETEEAVNKHRHSDGSEYVVSEKEWLRLSRRHPRSHSAAVPAGSLSGRGVMPLPDSTLPSTGPGTGQDAADSSSQPSTLRRETPEPPATARRPAVSISPAPALYQPLVMPEHFLPSATYYERLMDVSVANRKHRMAMLPPIDPSLPANEQVRHRIVQHLLETEESYIKTLKLLLDTYGPAISGLPSRTGLATLIEKLRTFFSTVQKIFSLHHMFKIGLSGPVSDWNSKQKIGPVFEGAFSKAMAIEVYSEYIEQFSGALAAIQNGRRTQRLFAEVLRCCDEENGLRLNLESLLLRPVQRFPQFLLILQDLLSNTAKDHPDRVPLQLALTRIENVTEQLNYRKRLSDQLNLVDRLHKRIMGWPLDMVQDKFRLISQDEVCEVKIKQGRAMWKKRCLFLFCKQLVCTSVLRPSSPFAFRSTEDFSYKFKWKKRLEDVTVIPSDLDVNTNSAKVVSDKFRGSPNLDTAFPRADGGDMAMQLRHERATLRHDMKMMTKIAALIATLRQDRPPITMPAVQEAAQAIQQRLTVLEEELRRCEAYRLDIAIPEGGPGSRMKHLSFVMSSPSARFSWVKSFNRTKLMLNEVEKPSWSVVDESDAEQAAEQLSLCSTETPLLVHTVPIMLTRDSMTLEMAVEVCVPNTVEGMPQYSPPYVWVCSNGGAQAAQISIAAGLNVNPVIVECFQCVPSRVLAMICVPGRDSTKKPKRSGIDTGEEYTTVWIGTQSKVILVYKAGMNDARMPSSQLKCVDSVLSLEYFNDYRFAGLADGSVIMFFKNAKGVWDSNSCSRIVLTSDPVSCTTVVGEDVFLAGGRDIHVVSTVSRTIVETFRSTEKTRDVEAVHGMLGVGIGLWLFHRHSTTIQLIHAETKEFIQVFDVMATVRRHQKTLGMSDGTIDRLYVTKLEHSPGQLWVGTSCGVLLLLPVPRLGGVPRIMGRALVSHHGNSGPVRIIVPVTSMMQLSISNRSVEFPGDRQDTTSPPSSLKPLPSRPNSVTSSADAPPLPPDTLRRGQDDEPIYDLPEKTEVPEEEEDDVYVEEHNVAYRKADDTVQEGVYTNMTPQDGTHLIDEGVDTVQEDGAETTEDGQLIYTQTEEGDGAEGDGEECYDKLHSLPDQELPSERPPSSASASSEGIYSALFDHADPIDPIAGIEERRRQSRRKKGADVVVVEQHYMVCGGLGSRYHSLRSAGRGGPPSEEGGELLVWELHHE